MKIYTKTGDGGTTSLVGGTRVSKSDPRLDAYGTIDELNSHLGVVLSLLSDQQQCCAPMLTGLQNKLFDLGAALATEHDSKWQPSLITSEDIEALESEIDRLTATLPTLKQFILPGGTPSAAHTHVARCVCRRAERLMAALPPDTCPGQTLNLSFVNRLSDYLFVLARTLNALGGHTESSWTPNAILMQTSDALSKTKS